MHRNPERADAETREIARVNQLTRAMLAEYVSWSSKLSYGETEHMLYGDMLEFVNLRMETADSCLLMIERRRVADSLALSRSLLEHYLLLMLMCRGRKYFRLQDLSALTKAQFKDRFEKQHAELRELQAQAKTQCLAVKKYPRQKQHLMYVFEGFRSNNESNFIIPAHFFQFQEFDPETMRLKDEDYFRYYQPQPEAIKRDRDYRQELFLRYRHYLSYQALLQCLELNDLADSATILRIEAHYTFLGKFLHPTHNAARDLHENSNVHTGKTAIGMVQEYSTVAVLLAALYVCYNVAGLIDEIAGLSENAPPKYVKQAGTDALRGLTERVATDFPYFWFLFNDPPLYDRYNYGTYHASNEELAEWGHYSNIPRERVQFDQYIYRHLERTLGGWSNARCGVYRSPLS